MIIRTTTTALAVTMATLFLCGCGTLDAFSSRVASINENIAAADDDNVVRNIVRASHEEPMSFVAVTKVTGERTADLKIGLPTATFGPGRVASQRQSVFGGNIGEGSQGYSVELAQLRTDTFTKGLMNPVIASQLENFSNQGISRELLFYLFIDSIRVQVGEGPGARIGVFRNDPELNDPVRCPPRTKEEPTRYNPAAELDPASAVHCPFRTFQFLVDTALAYGVSAQPADSAPPVDPKTEDAKKAAGESRSRGGERLCFEPALWATPAVGDAKNYICGSKTRPDEDLQLYFGEKPNQIGAKVSITLRSPYAMFEYLGSVSRMPSGTQPVLIGAGSRLPNADHQIFPLVPSGDACFVIVQHDKSAYCLPNNAYDAKVAVKVLNLLLQMNTNRTDLPTSAVSVQF